MASRRGIANEITVATYAFVQDFAASWHEYADIAATLSEPIPEELILHVAGPTDEGFRVIAVWTSEEAWRTFNRKRIEPALAARNRPRALEPAFRDLHPIHTLIGPLAQQRARGINVRN